MTAVVTASVSQDGPPIQTESAPTGTLLAQECGGCYLSQLQNDPGSMSTINGASDVVDALGWTEIAVAAVIAAPAASSEVEGAVASADAVTLRTTVALAGASPVLAQAVIDLGTGFAIGNQQLSGVAPQGPMQWAGVALGAAWWYLSDE